jgi:hypothetical protein
LAEKQFRTVVGTVEFDPRDGEAGGKTVRNITVQSGGFKDNAVKVGATLWPSHAHVEVKKGDVVVLKGSFTRNEGTNKEGAKVVYNNLSVSGILVLGRLDEGKRDNSSSTASESPTQLADDEELPF